MLQIIHERSKDLMTSGKFLPLYAFRADVYLPMAQKVTGMVNYEFFLTLRPFFVDWDTAGGPIDRPEEGDLYSWAKWYRDEDEDEDDRQPRAMGIPITQLNQ